MLSRFKVEHYKSLFDVDIDLEPLTVFIGPNGSGKSNVCEALVIISATLKEIIESKGDLSVSASSLLHHANAVLGKENLLKYILSPGHLQYLAFEVSRLNQVEISSSDEISNLYSMFKFLKPVVVEAYSER
jgi:AAA15 family ATPase/GTPase